MGSRPETLQTSSEAACRCSISSKLTMPLPKRQNSYEADLPPSRLSPPRTVHPATRIRYKGANAGQEGKVWPSCCLVNRGYPAAETITD